MSANGHFKPSAQSWEYTTLMSAVRPKLAVNSVNVGTNNKVLKMAESGRSTNWAEIGKKKKVGARTEASCGHR